MNILNNLKSKVTNYIDTKKQNQAIYDNILNNSVTFTLDTDIVTNDENIVTYNMYEYNNMCPYTNLDITRIIDTITPMNEIVLKIAHATGKKDEKEYFIVLTNLRFIIMNKQKYKSLNYQEITNFNLITKAFMSMIVSINNVILAIDVNEKELTSIYNVISNINYRNSLIAEKTKYLCGINPIYQHINKIGSGMSIDANNNIVFHDRMAKSYLCQYDNILNYELMEDNVPVLKKQTREQSQTIGVTKKECHEISLRITLNNNQTLEIQILEPAAFNSAYSHMDKTYMEYYNFGKELIDKLETYNKEIN